MKENLDCPDFIYIPVDCVDDMDYVIAAINYVIKSFGYKASWDCLNYVEVGGSIVFIFILRNFSYKKFLQSAL